jgi:hypothetical protein
MSALAATMWELMEAEEMSAGFGVIDRGRLLLVRTSASLMRKFDPGD